MPEINKLQPDRSIYLQGFDAFGAAASMHSATPAGFTVSGVFRDAADFAVLILYDADCYFEHPSFKYLPDFSLAGMVLSFDVSYTGLQPIDSQKFPTIDWPFLDVAKADGTPAQVSLFDNATLSGGSFAAASGVMNVETPGAAAFDSLVVWYQNIAFEFIAVGGETAAQVATAIAALINGTAWTTIGGIAALWATAVGAALTITYARYGEVSTNGFVVTSTAGQNFSGMASGDSILIGSTLTTVTATGSTTLSVADDQGVQTSIPYLAGRGGDDGNMVTLYAVAKNANLKTDVATLALTGGSSAATWNVSLDFTALGIDQVRQMWLTFAPELANAGIYLNTEWDAVFSNWAVADPGGLRLLQVAGQNSVRVEESDDYCAFTGTWSIADSTQGFWSQGFARKTAHVGDSVTVSYVCLEAHNLYLGTSLYSDRGEASVSIDGGPPATVDCYLNVTSAIATRRMAGSAIAAGIHSVTITLTGMNPQSTGSNFYFDFLEAAVLADVPDPPAALTNTSPAIDYDTNHGFQLSPARLMNIFDQLGMAGPVNEYVGVFWWNQRVAVGAVFPSVTVTFGGGFQPGDQILLFIGTVAPNNNVGKTVFANESNAIIAASLGYFINETFSGVWAAVGVDSGGNPTITITSRSTTAAYEFTFSASTELVSGSTGTVTVTGALTGAVQPSWVIDPGVDPPINYAARMWHADLFAQVAARGLTIVSSFSMELCNPPDNPAGGHVWAARYRDGTAVETATGFGTISSTQCVPSAPEFLAYQVAVFLAIAALQAAAGLTPEVQFGEHLWWYFSNYSATNLQGGMAYYDAATAAAAVASLGRPIGIFLTPNDDPSIVNGGADSTFLAGLLFAHDSAIAAAVRAAYPTAQVELLWPYDVNYPMPIGREGLGGALNFAVNLPAEWKGQAGSNLDRFKIEALDFGSGTRSLDLALKAIQFPGVSLGWPLQSIRYLFPVDNGGCPFLYEQQLAQGEGIPYLTPFAVDHVCLFGLDLREVLLPEIL
jgi:hypothetical protein